MLIAVPLVFVGSVLLSCLAPRQTADAEMGIIAVEESAYAEIRVVDMEGGRFMFIDGSLHAGIDLINGRSLFEYVDVLDIPRLFFDQPGRMLTVGLGGGSVVRNYAAEN